MCPSVCLLVVIGDWSGLSPQFRVSVQITQQVRTWGSPVLLPFLIRSQVRPGDLDPPSQLCRHWESGVDTRFCIRTKNNPEMEELMSWAWRDGTAPALLHFHFSTLAMKGSDLNQQLGNTLTLLMISAVSLGFFTIYLQSEVRLEVKHFFFLLTSVIPHFCFYLTNLNKQMLSVELMGVSAKCLKCLSI